MTLNLAANQNTERLLLRIAAQRKWYATAKRIVAAEFLLTGILPGIGIAACFVWPELRFWNSVITCGVWWVIFWALEPIRKQFCLKAASLQESIDVELLQLPDNGGLGALHIDKEDAISAGRSWINKHGNDNLRSWYPEVTDTLPSQLARVICQRSSLRWDGELRRNLSTIYALGCIGLCVLWLIVGLSANLSMRDAAALWLFPLLPAIYFLAKQAHAHRALADKKCGLKEKAHGLWKLAVADPLDHEKRMQEARELQDDIFRIRREPDLTPEWLYNCLRSRTEAAMTDSASEFVEEARCALRQSR